jgi:hypothetical protein
LILHYGDMTDRPARAEQRVICCRQNGRDQAVR